MLNDGFWGSEIAERSVGHATRIQRAKLPLIPFLKAALAWQSKKEQVRLGKTVVAVVKQLWWSKTAGTEAWGASALNFLLKSLNFKEIYFIHMAFFCLPMLYIMMYFLILDPLGLFFSWKFVALKGLQNWEKDTKLRKIDGGTFKSMGTKL